MVSPIYRLVQAPLRSLAFTVFGGLSLAHASNTVGSLVGNAAAGMFPFAVLLALALTAALLSSHEQSSDAAGSGVVRFASSGSLALLAVVSLLSAFSANGGLVSALGFAAISWSLSRISPNNSRLIEVRTKRSLISDSHVSAAH